MSDTNKNTFFTRKITLDEWELDLVVLGMLLIGLIAGSYLTLSNLFPVGHAAVSPWTQTNWNGGTSSGTVTGTVTTFSSGTDVDTDTAGQIILDKEYKIATLKGTQLSDNSTNLNVSTKTALQFNTSQDIDDDVFSYSGSNPTRLIVDEGGDYFISLTLPIFSDLTIGQRNAIEADIRVNGSKVDVGVGRSSYIRNASSHTEGSSHLAVLLEDLSANDYIEVFVINTTSEGVTNTLTSSFTLYAEQVPSTQTVFNATGTRTVASTDLNGASASAMEWTEGRKDAGYTHSDVTNSHQVTLDAVGNYFVTVNIPLGGGSQRTNVLGRVLLDGSQIDGGEFKQGYIRNAGGHADGSIHWSGVVQTSSINQVLTITTEQESASGTVTIDGEQATLFVQKLPSSTIYLGEARQVNNADDWNPAKSEVNWATDEIIDSSIYTHDTVTNNHQITVDAAGDYLLSFNVANTGGSARANPKATVQVNGSDVTGAVSSSSYRRQSSGHDQASTNLLFPLIGLSANDVITVSMEQESVGGTVNDDDEAQLMLWKKGYPDSGNLVSNVFDAEFAANWESEALSYNSSGSGTVTVKARSDSSSDMSGATAWGSCSAISSGSNMSTGSCVSDMDQYLQYQITLEPAGGNTPVFEDISIQFSPSDTVPPGTNASNVSMKNGAGGDTLVSNDWANTDEPYFSWDAGSDADSGLRGYCLYLGQDSNGDPETSKGLLGTSPGSLENSTCQFVVSASGGATESIDFATSSYHGSTWLTSDTDPYYLNIKAIDVAGNVFAGSSAQFQFRFDNTPPNNPAGLSAPQGFERELTSFNISWADSGDSAANDDHSGLAGYQYRISSVGQWYGSSHSGDEDCTDLITDTSYVLDETYDSLVVGENTFYLRTWDTACNVTTSYVTAILKYNAEAPSAPQNLSVDPASNDVNSFAFSWDAPTDYQGTESGLEYCYSINTLPSNTTCTFTSQNALSADAYATQPQTNTLYLVAKDEAGNINYADYASVDFVADTLAPGIPTNTDVSDVSIKATQNWKLAISWDEPTASSNNEQAEVDHYNVYRSTNDASCSTSFASFEEIGSISGTTYVDTELTQQDYYYCVKSCDSTNNCSAASGTATGFPDGKFTEPAELLSGPVSASITTQRATINWTTSRTSDSKVAYGTASGEYFEEEPSNSDQVVDHEISLNSLQPETKYYYVAKWTDEDGNTGTSDEKSFITSPAPSIANVGESNIGLDSALIRFTISNAHQATVLYGLTTQYGGAETIDTAASESTYSVPLTGLADGTTYHYKLRLEDADGNTYDFEDHAFTTIARPTVSNVRIQQVTGTAQPAVLVSWDSNTPISSIVNYYPQINPAAAVNQVDVERIQGEHQMLVNSLQAQTQYALIVRGVDQYGNEATSDVQTFTTATDTRPPRISNLQVDTSVVTPEGSSTPSAQISVSWDTDELTTSQVEFGEGTGTTYTQRTQEDANLTFNHLVIISDLDPSKVYHLRAVSKDSAGNIGNSLDTVTITPKATSSALDLVIGNLQQIFGFLLQ